VRRQTGLGARVGVASGSKADGTGYRTDAERLAEAVDGLRTQAPEFSAATGLWGWQKSAIAGLLTLVACGILLVPDATLVVVLAVMAIPFLFVVALRAAALWQVFSHSRPLDGVGVAARAPDAALPIYTVLVPLLREAHVVPDLLRALDAIDYPAEKLEVLLVVECIDEETQDALRRVHLASQMRVIVVPDGQPRTKPRACQYALQFAQGAYVVIYDAEDLPEPAQLRRALCCLQAAPGSLGCVQAQLNIYNSTESWLTRQFTIEYTALFDCILPTLERLNLPVPLGGTSNHFSRAVLDSVGGWDPFNVTEDADLGIRLARAGWQVGVLPSTTWEEAPPTFRVWLGQRTRWLKGWMQTYLVHMRSPRRLWRELGPRRFVGFQVLMGGLILSALVHPWFYAIVGADLWYGRLLGIPSSMAGQTILWIGVFNLVVGYLSAIGLGTVAAARRGRLRLAAHAVMMPVYWLAISFAAYRALWQLVTAPYYWEKTEHYLHPSSSTSHGTGETSYP